MRLVTRSDFDGLVCGVLLKAGGLADSYAFVHPRDIQSGLFPVCKTDILANVAYGPGCGMWFDHHSSEISRVGQVAVDGLVKVAPSCARVIWEYFGGHAKFPAHLDSLMDAVDRVDNGMLQESDINDPKGWILLGFIMDPRTGLQNQTFTQSTYELMVQLIDACATMPAEEILALPSVQERIARYRAEDAQFRAMLTEHSRVEGPILVTDLRNQEEIYSGNRFTPYAMYPECNVSVQIMWGFKKQRVVFAVGHSILNRSCSVDIGSLMLRYNGGGHTRVGTCQVPAQEAEDVLQTLITALKA